MVSPYRTTAPLLLEPYPDPFPQRLYDEIEEWLRKLLAEPDEVEEWLRKFLSEPEC